MPVILKRFLTLIVALIIALGGAKAQQTKLLTAEKHNEYGLVYTLPITAFKIEVTAIKETKVAGPFYEYAKKFAGDSQVIKDDDVSWTIQKITVSPYGIPNEEARYLMQLKAGATTFIGVSQDGMLLSINKDPKIPLLETSVQNNINESPTTGKEYLQYVNEDFLAAQSAFKKAQLLGEELMEIREAKISLTRGTAETMPTDGRQLELMLESLDKQEKALVQAFTGSSWKETVSRTFSFIPQEEGKNILFRFSDFAGIVDANDYSGEPVYFNVNVVEEAVLPVDAKGDEKKIPKDAVIYCIPGSAEINIAFKGNSLFSKVFEMSQFGMLFGLSPSIFTDKKEPSYAIFDPTTGAIKELGVVK